MYLMTQLWLFLGAALLIGGGLGYTLRQATLRRRMLAVQHGAYQEQQGQLATLNRLVDEHNQNLQAQAEALQHTLGEAHAQALAERCEVLDTFHRAALDDANAQARRDLSALVRAHDEVQAEARQALQRALAELGTLSATRQSHQAELASLHAELNETRQRLSEALSRHERALAEVVARAEAQGRAQLDAQSQAYEQALAAQHEALSTARHEQSEETRRLQAEAVKLREQLDVMLIELSAAARARDGREAQRAQLAQQLAIESAARQREAEIAGAQRLQLRERVVSLQQEVAAGQTSLQAQCEALQAQLLSSRRTTQAAVLAARQREKRLEAELHSLREQLLSAAERPAGATVHDLVRAA